MRRNQMKTYTQPVLLKEHTEFIKLYIAPHLKDKFKIEKIADEIEAIAPEFDKASFIAYAKGTMKKLDKLDTMHEYETEYKDLMSPEEYQHHTSNVNYRRT